MTQNLKDTIKLPSAERHITIFFTVEYYFTSHEESEFHNNRQTLKCKIIFTFLDMRVITLSCMMTFLVTYGDKYNLEQRKNKSADKDH